MNEAQQGPPDDATREAAREDIAQILSAVEEYQTKMGITDEEAEAAVEEAMEHVRPRVHTVPRPS